MTLGPEQMMGAAGLKRDDQEEREDAQPAQPLGQRAPEQDAARHVVQARQDGDAGGCEPAHGLEVRVEVAALQREKQWQGADGRADQPANDAHQH